MATLKQVIDAFDNYVEGATGLGINCIKGFPDFRQPTLATPLAALFYGGSGSGSDAVRKRIGASAQAVVVTLGIYASDEVNLFSLAEKLQDMRRRSPIILTAGSSDQVLAYIGEDQRNTPDAEAPKELRHFTNCSVVLVYEK